MVPDKIVRGPFPAQLGQGHSMSGVLTERTKLRKFLFIVWLLDSAALVVLFAVILLKGQTPDRIDLTGDLGGIWGGIGGFLMWLKWKARKSVSAK